MRARFDLLAVSRGRRDRQATLRATLDWSWDLMDPVEQLALMQLAVFAGSFSLEAAEAVLDLSNCDEPAWGVDVLQSLVDKSLVRSLPDGRFVLFLSIREYAAERARSGAARVGDFADLEEAAGHRHCEYFAALDGSQATALRCADLDNLVAACRWAVARGDSQLAPGALEAAWAALRCRGPFSTGIELATQVGGLHGLGQAARARVELTTGGALSSAGRDTEAQSHFERALQLARDAGVRRIEGQALVALANEELWSGRLNEARSGYANATTLAREIRDVDLECAALNGLGMTAEQCGDMETARLRYRESLDLAVAQGDLHWESSVLGNLGNIWATLGQLDMARKAYERSLQIASATGDRERESNALCNLGLLCFTQGDVDAARANSLDALTAAREMGHRRLECIVLCNLGMIDEQADDPESAQRRFEDALAIAEDMSDRRTSGQILTYLALLHARQRRFDRAHALLQSAEMLLTAVKDLPSLALLHAAHAETAALTGNIGEARQALQHAEALAHDLDAGAESELGAGLARVRTLLGLSAGP
jgi:tetratricopeptide (TPR) repeat protein